MIIKYLLVTMASLTLLAGCGGSEEFSDLQNKLEQIRSKPKGRIPPPPEFKPYATYAYSAHQLRSPFQKPVLNEPPPAFIEGISVQPDENRLREYLEGFALDSLVMAGSMQKPGEQLYILIKDPDGQGHRVAVGNYLGKNHGQIKEVTMQSISVVEIVPNGMGGWVERPRTISLAE